MLVLLTDDEDEIIKGVGPHVDGSTVVEDRSAELGDVRFIHVVKMRGISYLSRRYQFTITSRGIEVHPRLETLNEAAQDIAFTTRERVPLCISGLNVMLDGSVLSESTTLILGAPGTGKMVVGLHFIAEGARRGARLSQSFRNRRPG